MRIGAYTQIVDLTKGYGFVIVVTTWAADAEPREPQQFDGFVVRFDACCGTDTTDRCRHCHSLRVVGMERYDCDQCFINYEWTVPRLIEAPGDDGSGAVCLDCVLEGAATL